ncbi:unnamed protein product, partial [marine sediment metagenome]
MLAYLSRYTHRVAISNSRLMAQRMQRYWFGDPGGGDGLMEEAGELPRRQTLCNVASAN